MMWRETVGGIDRDGRGVERETEGDIDVAIPEAFLLAGVTERVEWEEEDVCGGGGDHGVLAWN